MKLKIALEPDCTGAIAKIRLDGNADYATLDFQKKTVELKYDASVKTIPLKDTLIEELRRVNITHCEIGDDFFTKLHQVFNELQSVEDSETFMKDLGITVRDSQK